MLIVPQVYDDGEATELARRILDSMRHPVKLLGHNTSVTASVGISISTSQRNQPRELLRSADVALFHAKELGRGRFVLFDETLDRYSMERLELESELREAVDRDQLILEYQPEVDLATGRIIGAEALVRWERPDRGRIVPGEFISLAEETGEIVKIGKWVLGTASRQAAEWKAHLPPGSPFTMAINLSANEFMEAGLPWEVLRTLRETSLDPGSLRIEITESVLLHDAPFINEVFLDLKQLGVELAIDDFGTGYSSLSYLRKLPADVLKIDRSFVADIDHRPARGYGRPAGDRCGRRARDARDRGGHRARRAARSPDRDRLRVRARLPVLAAGPGRGVRGHARAVTRTRALRVVGVEAPGQPRCPWRVPRQRRHRRRAAHAEPRRARQRPRRLRDGAVDRAPEQDGRARAELPRLPAHRRSLGDLPPWGMLRSHPAARPPPPAIDRSE